MKQRSSKAVRELRVFTSKKKKKNSSSPEDRSTLKQLQKLFSIPIPRLTIHLDSYQSKVSLPFREFSCDSVTGPGDQEMNENREVLLWELSLETQRNSNKQSKGVRNEAEMSYPSSTFLGTDTPNLR